MSTALPSFVGATAASTIMVGMGALRRAGFCPDPAKLRPNPRAADEVIACDRVSARAGAGQAAHTGFAARRDGASHAPAMPASIISSQAWGTAPCVSRERRGTWNAGRTGVSAPGATKASAGEA